VVDAGEDTGARNRGKGQLLSQSSLRIRELEIEERGNYFPNLPYPDTTPCIWICLKPEDCFYYEPEYTREDLTEVEINEKSILCNFDYNGGFLLLQPF